MKCYKCSTEIAWEDGRPVTIGDIYGYGRFPDQPDDDLYEVSVCQSCWLTIQNKKNQTSITEHDQEDPV